MSCSIRSACAMRVSSGLRRQVARQQLRTPLDFGFHEVAGINGCDPALLQKLDLNPDRVPRPANAASDQRAHDAAGRGPSRFAMWGYKEGDEEATPEYRYAPNWPSA